MARTHLTYGKHTCPEESLWRRGTDNNKLPPFPHQEYSCILLLQPQIFHQTANHQYKRLSRYFGGVALSPAPLPFSFHENLELLLRFYCWDPQLPALKQWATDINMAFNFPISYLVSWVHWPFICSLTGLLLLPPLEKCIWVQVTR